MVISKEIKASVIWSGTVGSYDLEAHSGGVRTALNGGTPPDPYGNPQQDLQFWASISPMTYIGDLSAPLQLHHDLADSEVAFKYSQELFDRATQAGKSVELYSYPGNDHNLANSFGLALQRSVAFFDQFVKGK